MGATIRVDTAHRDAARCYTAGILVPAGCREAEATVLAVQRGQPRATPQIVATRRAAVPPETAALLRQLQSSGAGPWAAVSALRLQLAEVETRLLGDLLLPLPQTHGRVLAVGVYDPGLWSLAQSVPVGYLELSDAARLAEATGLNFIDAFPARDLAQGGQGGPITAIAEWILLRHPQKTRLRLHLGSTVQMTLLPPAGCPDVLSRIVSFDVGPGTQLLDLFVERLTAGQQRFDPGGRQAVQGRRIPEIIDHWRRDPFFERPLPRWHPRGVGPERFVSQSLDLAVQAGWSVRDLLCSATHFIAEMVVQALGQRLPADLPVEEIIVTGGGQQNGMLLREIAARLPKLAILHAGDLGLPGEALGSACIALLALMHLEQMPANSPALTGTDIPRVLGRLTPGSPQAWQRLLQTYTAAPPATPSTRVA